MKTLAIRLGLAISFCVLALAIAVAWRSAIRTKQIQHDAEGRETIERRLASEFARKVANGSPMPPAVPADGLERARTSMLVMPMQIPLPQTPGIRLVQPTSEAQSTLRSSPRIVRTPDKGFEESAPKLPAVED